MTKKGKWKIKENWHPRVRLSIRLMTHTKKKREIKNKIELTPRMRFPGGKFQARIVLSLNGGLQTTRISTHWNLLLWRQRKHKISFITKSRCSTHLSYLPFFLNIQAGQCLKCYRFIHTNHACTLKHKCSRRWGKVGQLQRAVHESELKKKKKRKN